MIGYSILVLVALLTTIVGFIVVGVAVWGWGQQKKAAIAAKQATSMTLESEAKS